MLKIGIISIKPNNFRALNPELPESHTEILSLHLKLKASLGFGGDSEQLYAERSDTGSRFSITEWQMHLLMGMDGEKSLGDLLQEAGSKLESDFNFPSLKSFCARLYKDSLVAPIAQIQTADESIFELVLDGDQIAPQKGLAPSWISLIKNWDQILKYACYAVTILGVIRIAWVVAPVFDPVMERANLEITEIFREDKNNRTLVDKKLPIVSERVPVTAKTESFTVAGKIDKVKLLREQLAECRIRRDEYYLQNEEEGYRIELEKMTMLTRKIGELEITD